MRQESRGLLTVVVSLGLIGSANAAVLRVCNDTPGFACPSPAPFTSIQAAVDAATAGDWILVAPGIYHEKGTVKAGVMVTKPNLHIRGLDRNTVIVDGTNSTDPTKPCTDEPSLQDKSGRNGIEVRSDSFGADGVSIENLTVCNYLAGAGGAGNQIWWNGGDGSGTIGMGSYHGAYLTATSSYFSDANAASYGIFVSNARGPGDITDSYASNMSDSSFYVGACPDCNVTLDRVHGVNSPLGYSGTNSGGHLVIQNSEFDHNLSGVAPNSLNNDDAPPPQDGRCPGWKNGERGPTGTVSCTIIRDNDVHDNNNPNVPASGVAGTAPVGTGIELSGTQFDTVIGNYVHDNDSWGIVLHDYPDTETPPSSGISHCQGGIDVPGVVCDFPAIGNDIAGNHLHHNGSNGNLGNADLANAGTGFGNCFHDNYDDGNPLLLPGLPTSAPPLIQLVDSDCRGPTPGDFGALLIQLVCASGVLQSAAGDPRVTCSGTPLTKYPQRTGPILFPRPVEASMPDPCDGVPPDPSDTWCPSN